MFGKVFVFAIFKLFLATDAPMAMVRQSKNNNKGNYV